MILLNKVYHADALSLLARLNDECVGLVCVDAMYGVSANYRYGDLIDPGRGDPEKHWAYHGPIYSECRRVLRAGGKLAWGVGCKFQKHFAGWYGGHRLWTLVRFGVQGVLASGQTWLVQTREQEPVDMPNADGLIFCDRRDLMRWRRYHPCPKPVEEMRFMVRHLSEPGELVLDCCCGVGSGPVAAAQLGRRFLGCDCNHDYARIATWRVNREMSGREQTQLDAASKCTTRQGIS